VESIVHGKQAALFLTGERATLRREILRPLEVAMVTSATIPVTVTPEAAGRLAELGLQAQVDRVIEYARQNLPELTRIEVVLNERGETGGKPGIAIDAYRRFTSEPTYRIGLQIGDWMVSEFPPEVLEHLLLDYLPDYPNAG
jgi:hypothetical protein